MPISPSQLYLIDAPLQSPVDRVLRLRTTLQPIILGHENGASTYVSYHLVHRYHSVCKYLSVTKLITRPDSSGDFVAHYTTFADVDQYAFTNAQSAYGSLPSYKTLKFEPTRKDLASFFFEGVDHIPMRLMLGYARTTRPSTKATVYAYMWKKESMSKVSLHRGNETLTVLWLDAVDFVRPFDVIYDNFGMTERAMKGLRTMVGYYFLAAGHVEEITTYSDNYRATFARLCEKIQSLPGSGWQSDAGTAAETQDEPSWDRTILESNIGEILEPLRGHVPHHTDNDKTGRGSDIEPTELERQTRHLERIDNSTQSQVNSGCISIDNTQPVEVRAKIPVSTTLRSRHS
jgi:hypothetical protein